MSDFSNGPAFGVKTGVIITSSAAAVLDELSTGFVHRLSDRGGAILQFPDESVQIEVQGDASSIDSQIVTVARLALDCTGFRSIGCFPKQEYALWYSSDFAKRLGEDRWHIFPGCYTPPTPDEFETAHLTVTLEFRRKPSAGTREALRDALMEWSRTLKRAGLSAEEKLRLVAPGIEFRGRLARFSIDIRGLGQDALNWLTLCLFNVADRVALITDVYYGQKQYSLEPDQPSHIENLWTASGPQHLMVPFAVEDTVVQPKRQPPNPVLATLDEAAQHPSVRSDRFKIGAHVDLQVETLQITVAFANVPDDAGKRDLAELFRAWLTVGQYGALGSQGIRWYDELLFDLDTTSATINVDLGDAEEVSALSLLVRMLDGYDAQVAPLEGVLLGDWRRMVRHQSS